MENKENKDSEKEPFVRAAISPAGIMGEYAAFKTENYRTGEAIKHYIFCPAYFPIIGKIRGGFHGTNAS